MRCFHPTNRSPYQRTPKDNSTINKTIIRFDSNPSNPLNPHTIESVEIHNLHTSHQYPSSAASLAVSVQTLQAAALRVPSLFLSTVVPLNGKFPSLGSTVSHSVSYPTLRGRIASVVRLLGRSSVNDPSITRIISYATHYRRLTSNSQSVPSKACSLQSLFSFLHHP